MRRTDKWIVTHRNKAKARPSARVANLAPELAAWPEGLDCLERDDRSWLEALQRDQEALFTMPHAHKDTHPPIQMLVTHIVTALEFASHSRWGMQAPADEVRELEEAFLRWMTSSDSWTRVKKMWADDKRGPWSLPLALSRCYLRFQKTLRRDSRPRLERRAFPRDNDSLEASLARPVVEAFESLVEDVPAGPVRLCYQLHLDGLLDEEISRLLDLSVEQVAASLNEAKSFVEELIMERNYGT